MYGNGDLPAPELRASDSALGAYLRAIRTHLVVFVLVSATALVAAGAWAVLRTPEWGATARILVSPLEQGDRTYVGTPVVRESASDPTRTMQTASTLIDSRNAATRAAQALGDGWTGAEVADAVTVQTEGESNVLAVRATASEAREAARVANAFATAALEVRDEALRERIDQILPALRDQQRAVGNTSTQTGADLAVRVSQLETARSQGDPTLGLEEQAYVAEAVGPRRSLVVVLALVAGLALGAAAAILLELTTQRLRDTEEAGRLFPLPVLSRVPRPSRRDRRALTAGLLLDDPAFQEAYRSLALQLYEGGDEGHAVLLTSGSTGDGTTTSAIHLALSLAQAGSDVILLDADLRSPQIHRRLRLPVRGDVLTTPGADLESALVAFEDLPLYVLSPGDVPLSPADADELRSRLPQLLADARAISHFVVIDAPPLGEVGDAIPLLRDVDDVIVVVRPRHTQRASFLTMRDLIVRSGARSRGMLVIGEAGHLPPTEPPARPLHPRRRRVRLRRGPDG